MCTLILGSILVEDLICGAACITEILLILCLVGIRIWAPFQYEGQIFHVYDFHYKDKTVMRRFYLYSGNVFTGKMESLYWRSIKRC